MESNESLKTLNIGQNDINHEGVSLIVRSLIENTTLEKINLSNIFFTNLKKKKILRLDAFEALRDLFILNNTIREFYFDEIQLEMNFTMELPSQLLVEGMIYNNGIETFSMKGDNMNDDIALNFLWMLQSNSNVKNFYLGNKKNNSHQLRIALTKQTRGSALY